eukprot:gb/GEZN01025893.1/.p1 GENE.gb/GEZN01025893.1/~~gb/GEZN01025893.1/.p1  ORF type:complete len:129 (-),score=5.41 gb/GEZN01025893.1/:147-533(-)
MLIIGVIIASISLMYTVHSTTSKAPDLFRSTPEDDTTIPVELPPHTDAVKYWLFHMLMVFASFYMAMLITGWADDGGATSTQANTGISKVSMWIKISAQWITWVLYLWTLLGPICFPDRDFSSPRRLE